MTTHNGAGLNLALRAIVRGSLRCERIAETITAKQPQRVKRKEEHLMRTPIASLAIAGALTGLIAGCSSGATNTTSNLGGANSSATAAAASDPKTAASDQAIGLVGHYYQTLSRLDADYTIPISAADQVASGLLLETTKADVTVRRSKGITITGQIAVDSKKATDVRLTPMPATVHVRVCVDTSSRDAKFPDGSSALAADRMMKSASNLTVENPSWPDPNGWRVTGDSAKQERRQEPCDG